MSSEANEPIERLIHHLSRLPGIGTRTATRLAYHIIRTDDLSTELAQALQDVADGVGHCSRCFNVSSSDPCSVCSEPRRDPTCICVVERTQDLQAIERTGSFQGHFHVLGGVLSPLDGVGPEELKIRELLERLEEVTEVILATNPTVEGDATSLYLARLLKPLGVQVSRIARGVSVGAELEFTDRSTLSRALEERREI